MGRLEVLVIKERSDARGYNKEEDQFLLLLQNLALKHLILRKRNANLNSVRKKMRHDRTVRPKEVTMSNEVWQQRNHIREYIQEQRMKETFYVGTKDDLEMIFLYLERSVKIAESQEYKSD